MAKLRVGIIGTGGISNNHMSGYIARHDDVEVVAVCDIDQPKVEAYAAKYGVPKWYTDAAEMVAIEQLDAVSVTTWNAAHKNASILALRSGANVLCEKPMALNAIEAREMEVEAIKAGKLLMIGFVRRFGNDADVLKKLIDDGKVGDLYYAKACYLRRNGCPGGWFGDKRFSGGGPLIDLGVHVMDLVRYLSGYPKPVSVFGATFSNLGPNRAQNGQAAWQAPTSSLANQYEYNVEDFATAKIRFDSGLVLDVETSFNLNIKEDKGTIELFGTKAGLKIDPSVEMYTDMSGLFVNVQPHGNTALEFNSLFEREISHFVDCVRDGIPCRNPARDGVVLMQMIDAIYKSAQTGREVIIDSSL